MTDKFLVPIDLQQSDTVTSPAAGFTRLQAKTDGKLYSVTPAGVQTDLSGPVTMSAAFLTATQSTTATTPTTLTGHTFQIPPGKSALIQGNMAYTAAATTTGGVYGFRVAQGAGANGNAQGSWFITNSLTNAAAATALEDGDVLNIAAGATSAFLSVISGTTAATNIAQGAALTAVVKNQSTNATTTVTIDFASEVNGSAVTAQIGSGSTVVIG